MKKKKKPVYVTLAMLRRWRACADSIRWFEEVFGDKALVSIKNLKLADVDNRAHWLYTRLVYRGRQPLMSECWWCNNIDSDSSKNFAEAARVIRAAIAKAGGK